MEIMTRIPLEYRSIALLVLTNPLTQHTELRKLVTGRPDESGKRFGCVCCPNARFQSMKKAERHLQGQFGIRLYACDYWWAMVLRTGI
jgi:hypothetical protein